MALRPIIVSVLEKRYQPLASSIERIAERALALFSVLQRRRPADIFQAEIFLVSNSEMRRLNRSFRQRDKTTNVLAFPAAGFLRPDLAGNFLGEIFLAPDYIAARRQDLPKLVIHGLAHLFGYDHKSKNDRIRMEKIEDQIFKKL